MKVHRKWKYGIGAVISRTVACVFVIGILLWYFFTHDNDNMIIRYLPILGSLIFIMWGVEPFINSDYKEPLNDLMGNKEIEPKKDEDNWWDRL